MRIWMCEQCSAPTQTLYSLLLVVGCVNVFALLRGQFTCAKKSVILSLAVRSSHPFPTFFCVFIHPSFQGGERVEILRVAGDLKDVVELIQLV